MHDIIKKLAEDIIKIAEEKNHKAFKMGADITEPDIQLKLAKKAFAMGTFEEAINKGRDAEKAADLSIDIFRDIQDKSRSVQDSIRNAEDWGGDMTSARKLLDQAKAAQSNQSKMYYLNQAENYAIKDIEQRAEIKKVVNELMTKIEEFESNGGDATEARTLFEKATKASQYESARRYLDSALEILS